MKRYTTIDGFEMIFGVSHLGHFFLTYLLWERIQKSQFFRIVNVSSLAHKYTGVFKGLPLPKIPFDNLNSTDNFNTNVTYGMTKLANVMFTLSLVSKTSKEKGIIASLHPGFVRTQIYRDLTKTIIGKIFIGILYPLIWLTSKSPQQGSQTTLYALLGGNVKSGQYYADCKIDEMNSEARNQENQKKLWKVSQEMLKIKFDI